MVSLIFKPLRIGLGLLIVFISAITLPKQLKRSEDEQVAAQEQANELAIYQFYACPFCVKTRRTVHALNIDIEYRDAKNNATHRTELLEQGGEIKVPCLRIDEAGTIRWLYESSDIIRYLNTRFENS